MPTRRALFVPGFATLVIACAAPVDTEDNAEASNQGPRPNILLICIDDLRPELGCYGVDYVQSPHLDAFAEHALRFDRQYVQFPTCGASRYAFLTGQHPSQPAHYSNGAFNSLREQPAGAEPIATLPGSFRAAGYHTVALGKISHSHDGRTREGLEEVPGAWDALPTEAGVWKEARHLLHAYADGGVRVAGQSPITESLEVEDEAYPDAHLAAQAIAELQGLEGSSEPFLLAVGFFKPHLPFAAPKRYWDLYDPNSIPPSPAPSIPEDLPVHNGWSQSGEVTNNYAGAGFEDGSWSIEERRHLRHGYLACVSYVDAQVGKLLQALEDSSLRDNTIVIVWGDHGWHLGDLGLFGKHTTYEASLRSPLLIRVPGRTDNGAQTQALVEAIDVFPTLAELCGVPAPTDIAGRSFAKLLDDPDGAHRSAAHSFWRRGNWLATSIRTRRHRLTGWADPVTGRDGTVELYELEPEDGSAGAVNELENISKRDPALVKRLIERHLRR